MKPFVIDLALVTGVENITLNIGKGETSHRHTYSDADAIVNK